MARKLAAILAADVVGYSSMMAEDEIATLAALKAHRQSVFEPMTAQRGGRIVKLMGDGALVEFPSVVEAVECAIAVQSAMAEQPSNIRLRIGVNLGDVITEGDDIYGDGVNVASRLEALASPGGICISSIVRESIGNRAAHFVDAGDKVIKGAPRPIRVWQWSKAEIAKAGKAWAISQSEPRLPDKPSIAVLPLTNMSGDPEQEYFADGLTEDIITELSRFRALSVIARNSTFTYKGQSPNIQDVGRALGVRYVVEGSIRKAVNRVRITAQLIEVANNDHIWAERYDRELQDIFEVQDEVTRAIVSAVAGRVDSVGRQRVIRAGPDQLTAYDLYLRARALIHQFTREKNAEARSLLTRAVALDPTSAQAHTLLCTAHYMDWVGHWVKDSEDSLNESIRWGKRAVAIDSADSGAHWNLGEAYIFAREFDKARFHFEKAITLNPNDVEARTGYGFFLTCVGHADDAIEEFERARQVDPQDLSYLPWLEGFALFTARRYGEAIACFEKIEGPHYEVISLLAASYAHIGNLGAAARLLEEFLRRAESEMVGFPGRSLAGWRQQWHTLACCMDEADREHWLDGLRIAGLNG